MKTMYKVNAFYGMPRSVIIEVSIERESDSSIWIKGNRHNKMSQSDCYFDTREEAYNHILRLANLEVSNIKIKLERAQERLKAIKELNQ